MASEPLVPKLRFPEFRHAPGWVGVRLADVTDSISSGISLPQHDHAAGAKVTRIETIAEGSINLGKVGYVTPETDLSAYRLAVGDILFSNINSVTHIGKSVLVDQEYDLYHGMNLLRLRVKQSEHAARFVHLSISSTQVRDSFRARANKAVNQASINQTELGLTTIPMPCFAEQHRIAECLTSRDELIAAEGRKLAALRAHKKGLMQGLFPREGETTPRLRFPEFRDAGAWKRLPLFKLAVFVNEKVSAASVLVDN